MQTIKNIGLCLFLIGLTIFTGSIFYGNFNLNQEKVNSYIEGKKTTNTLLKESLITAFDSSETLSIFEFSSKARSVLEATNKVHKENKDWGNVIWEKPHSFSFALAKKAGEGILIENAGLLLFLTFGLGSIGALLFMLPNVILLGKPGIKNNGVYLESSTNRGWSAWLVMGYLVSFYIVLYFYADYVVNWTFILDPLSLSLSGKPASQWFVYGFLYCTIMLLMGIRMYIKYRHNRYQLIRTTSVIFFQIVFAFLIPEIMTSLNMPGYDFKNAFPLDYDFFFEWNIKELMNNGFIGVFILVWGIVLTIVIVPVMVYFFGKRWYCSWVCGCGGLAETLGDPYRQHSDKSINAWKLERWVIHSVLLISLIMTLVTLYCYFTGARGFIGISSQWIKR